MCVGLGLCCCIGGACSGVCSCLCCSVSCFGSRVTRLAYTLGLLLVTVVAWAIKNWGDHVVPEDWQHCPGGCFNYLSVYRISLGFALYHAVLCIFTIGVTTSKSPRAKIHNGFWWIKALVLIGTIIGCFFIPVEFFKAYAIICIVGGVLFLLLQTIIILDFAYIVAETWVEKWEEERDICWQVLLIGSTIVCYIIVVAFTGVLYAFFAKGEYLGINVFLITFNIVLIILFSIFSVLPAVQEANPKSGILQAALIGAYITYVIASSLGSEPTSSSENCIDPSDPDAFSTFSKVLFYLGFATTFVALCVSSFSATSSEESFSGSSDDLDDEKDATAYKYYFFHLVFVLASCYMAVLLNNWAAFQEDNSSGEFCIDHGMGSVWAKAATSWLIALLYIWTLFAPVVFPDRFGV